MKDGQDKQDDQTRGDEKKPLREGGAGGKGRVIRRLS